jgi:hypothetical protein
MTLYFIASSLNEAVSIWRNNVEAWPRGEGREESKTTTLGFPRGVAAIKVKLVRLNSGLYRRNTQKPSYGFYFVCDTGPN